MMAMMSGGIKGGNTTFNQSLLQNERPKESSISCTSIFSKYLFDMKKNSTDDFVDISLLRAKSIDPLTNEQELYIGMGLLSSEDGKNKREDLNLVVVLDISGSMSGSLDRSKHNFTKLDLAKSCIRNIYDKLFDHERLSLITFNNFSEIILPLTNKKEINKKEFFDKLFGLNANGGTTIEAGYTPAVAILQSQIEMDAKVKEKELKTPTNHRIIFITDALINDGNEADSLYKINAESSKKPSNIFTTFIGVGVDFDTDLISKLTKVRGSNYFAVHTEEEFRKTLENDFNYIVTPLCFDVFVNMQSNKYEIQRTYGSEFDFKGLEDKGDEVLQMKQGGVLKIDTLTAYEKTPGGIKGGVVLIKLKEKKQINQEIDNNITVTISYELISGVKQEVKRQIKADFDQIKEKEFFESTGIRKALLLSRYVCFVKEALKDVKKVKNEEKKFITHFKEESKILEDSVLKEELDNLEKILGKKK